MPDNERSSYDLGHARTTLYVYDAARGGYRVAELERCHEALCMPDAKCMAAWIKAHVALGNIDPPPFVTQAAERALDAR